MLRHIALNENYHQLHEVAQDIQGANGDITPEQLAKFSKLQTDLMAEAMKVQAKMKK